MGRSLSLLALLLYGCSTSSVDPPTDAAIDLSVPDSSLPADLAANPPDLAPRPPDLAPPPADLSLADLARDLYTIPHCLDVLPSPVQCPPTRAGQKAPPVAVTLTNKCNRDINVFGLFIGGPNPGDFTFTLPNKPPFAIPAGGQVDASVVFGPTAIGPRSGFFTITSDDPAGSFVGQMLGTGI